MVNQKVKLASAMLVLALGGCQPTDRPTNLANMPALNKAKAVEGQLQQSADQRKVEEEQQQK
jgi:hypothetical protein